MRRDWRNVLLPLALFLAGTSVAIARQNQTKMLSGGSPDVVRMTVEVSWGAPRPESGASDATATGEGGESPREFTLEVTNGRLIDLMDWPPLTSRPSADGVVASPSNATAVQGAWKLGTRSEGRVRARVEAPLDSSLVVRGGAQAIGIPLAAVLERPQRTPPQSRLVVSVERLPWDSIVVDLGESGRDGIVAPGSTVPVSVGYNILWPEANEVSVRTSAVLRPMGGGEVLWRDEPREVIAANVSEPPSRIWSVRAPRAEGTYVLEVRATWEPTAGHEGSRLARLIRRRKPGWVTSSAVRRVAFTVVDPAARVSAIGHDGSGRDTEVDSVDLSRPRSHRPVATGRSPAFAPGSSAWGVPAEALIEPSRRDLVRGWFMRNGGEAAKLDAADAGGLAWTAVGLKVMHPDRPHRLTLKIKAGEPSALGVALVESSSASGGASALPRVLLDACASGPPILRDGPAAGFEWLVFPHASEMVLVMVNRSPEAEVRAGAITLSEIEETAAAAPGPEPASRALGLYLTGSDSLNRFGAQKGSSDPLRAAQNLVKYLGCCGATAVVLSEDLTDRAARRRLFGQADEDPTGPDRVEIVRQVLARQGCALWLELRFDGPDALPGLPAADSAESLMRGLVRIDSQGRPDGPAYNPLNPEVREAMKRRVSKALSYLKVGKPLGAGLVIRLGPGPTLLGTPDTGLDDATYQKFTHDTFGPETAREIPGVESTDPGRFAVRSTYLAGKGRMPWLSWRSKEIASLYTELNATMREVSPAARLAVVTPGLDGGPVGAEARRVDRAALPPSQSWRSVGLDLQAWPSGPGSPLVLRGTALSTEALSHDLATSPDLDSLVASRPTRGMLLAIGGEETGRDSGGIAPGQEAPEGRVPQAALADSSPADPDGVGRSTTENTGRGADKRGPNPRAWLTALPLGDGPAADLPLGHALAALDAQWVFIAEKAASGQEDRLRNFARVLCALPAKEAPAGLAPDGLSKPFGVVVRNLDDGAKSFLEIANDSPYPVRVAGRLDSLAAAQIEDVGRGLRLRSVSQADGSNLVLDLLPYGVAAIRIAAPQVKIRSVNSYPSDAVMTGMRTRFNELSAQLARLNHGLSAAPVGPANPGFEPDSNTKDRAVRQPEQGDVGTPSRGKNELAGWLAECTTPGAATIAIDHENPHSGQGSLKLSSPMAYSSVVSESFVPNIHSSLTIEAYFRASESDTKVRVWIEGESSGKPYIRRTEMTVSTAWEGRAVRASDVPAGGLEKARLRFELLGPGNLWIDDLHVPSETTSKSGLVNARRTLLEAIQAYREERYAEFARLAGSHWIQESSAAATTRLARAPDPASRPGGGPARPSSTEPNALSPDRMRR
jgi:hypothetical protein